MSWNASLLKAIMLISAISHRFTGNVLTFWRLWGFNRVRCCPKSCLFISTVVEISKGLIATKHLQYECKRTQILTKKGCISPSVLMFILKHSSFRRSSAALGWYAAGERRKTTLGRFAMQQPKGRSGMYPKWLFPSAFLMLHQSCHLCIVFFSMEKNIWSIPVSCYTGRVVCYWEKSHSRGTSSLTQEHLAGKRGPRNRPTMVNSVKLCNLYWYFLQEDKYGHVNPLYRGCIR